MLLFLTTVMEVVLVCFLLSTLERLPYPLEGEVCSFGLHIKPI